MTDPIGRLLAELAKPHSPLEALELVAACRAELDDLDRAFELTRNAEIDRARAHRLTWREIGDALGISLQRAHELGKSSAHPSLHQPKPTERTRT